jgi:hypothetical protein
MKLILCRCCQDVFKLRVEEERTCACGQVGGKYLKDGVNAVYWGENAVPIAFGNSTLADAIIAQPEESWGENFTAWVIPKVCYSMRKIEKPNSARQTRSSRVGNRSTPRLPEPPQNVLMRKKERNHEK